MDLSKAERILIFGGSFDPPHRAHVELPQLVCERYAVDAIVYVPTGIPPHKPDRTLTDPHHRVAMLTLALQGIDCATIDTIEIERANNNEPTYTVDTLEAFRTRYPQAKLYLLIGADQMRDFPTWKNNAQVLQLAEPIVMARGDEALPDASWKSRLIATPQMSISATELRQRMRKGLPIDNWVHPQVAQYIAEHKLYRD